MAEDQENYLSDGTDPRLPRKQAEIEAQAEDQHNTEVAKKRAEYEDLQRRHRAMMDSLTANKRSMFGKTPPEVSVNALALAVEEAHQLTALRQLEGKPADDARDIRAFSAQIHGREVAFYYEGRQKPSFIDDGKNIYVPDFDEDAALLASLQLAQQRWGVVKINGTADFKERVVQMAVEHDLKLSNRDLAEMVKARREAEGVLSAPSEEERQAAEEFHASPAEATAPAASTAAAKAPAAPKPQAQPEDEDEVIEASPETAPAAPASPAPVEASKPEPAAPAPATEPEDDKAWIRAIQEERRLKKEAAMQAQKEASVEADKAVVNTENAVASIVFDEDVPEEEIDLGMGDDDDFDPMATADPVPASPQKTAAVGVRP